MRPGRRTIELRLGACVRASALALVLVAVASSARAQATAAPPDAEAPAPGEATPTSESSAAEADDAPSEPAGADAADAASSEDAAELSPTAEPAAAGPTREALLQAAIVDAERDQPSVLLPWLALGVSVATLTVGTTVGVINVAGCDGSCSTAAVWPWMVIAGCTLTSASTAWLIVALHDQSEAKHRLERARRELERDQVDHGPRASAPRLVTLRASF